MKNKKNLWLVGGAALLLYALLNGALIALHEPWRDELQSWLIARDCDIGGIIYMMRFEGHFATWSLLLKPLASAEAGVVSMNILSGLLCLTAAAVVMFKSPFTLPVRVLIIFSAPFLYWNPVLARPYALVTLTVVLLAAVWPRRKEKPLSCGLLLALLSNTHAYMEGLAGILFIFFAWDLIKDRKNCPQWSWHLRLTALAIPVVAAVFAFCQVFPAFGLTKEATLRADSPSSLIERITLTFSTFAHYYTFIGHPLFKTVFYTVLIAVLVYIWRISRRVALASFVGILWMLLFAALLYSIASQQQCYLAALMLLFGCWVAAESRKEASGEEKWTKRLWTPRLALPFCLFLLLSWKCTLQYALLDAKHTFSSIRETADFISAKLPAGTTLFMFPTSIQQTGIAAYLSGYTLRSSEDHREYTYMIMTKEMRRKLDKSDVGRCWEFCSRNGFHVLVHRASEKDFLASLPEKLKARELYRSPVLHPAMLSGDSYIVYFLEPVEEK